MKRNKHSLSHYHLLTADMGRLVPVGMYEVLPGDTVQQSTSMLLRVSPLVAPVMHPVSVRIHHWFVPYRLLWDQWESFITGGTDGEGDGAVFPTVSTGPTGVAKGSIGDYFGIPPEVPNLEVSRLPFRAYNLIFNEFYRDQDLVDPWIGTDEQARVQEPFYIGWEKDYFTASRPWPQKGPDVTMPIGTSAPVVGTAATPTLKGQGGSQGALGLTFGAGTSQVDWSAAATASELAVWNDPALVADLSSATAVNVNDVRLAFALQRYQEARAQYGSRYTEYLRYLGVRSSDARLQRPEYLGGGKQTISFSEVLQTAPGADSVVGELKGHGIAAMRSRRFRRFFEEHGIVLSLMSVRPRTMYSNGVHRMFSRRTKEDFWQKELEQIGQQEVYRREVFAEADNAGSGGDAIFGYNDRYAEYKHHPSTVHAEFRELMNYWHLARNFAAAPALNTSFIQCDPSKRIFAEQSQNSLWIMASNSIQARRMVRRNASSRIL